MLFADYADLRLTLTDRIKRDDLDVELKRFVLMAEEELNQRLRHPDMVSTAPIALVAGIGNLPTDFLEMEDLWMASGKRIEGSERKLNYEYSGNPDYYHISNGKLYVGNLTTTVQAEYYARLPTLTTNATATNWLLTRYPTVYYHAVLKQVFDFLEDVDRLNKADSDLSRAVLQAKIDGDRKRYGDSIVRPRGFRP